MVLMTLKLCSRFQFLTNQWVFLILRIFSSIAVIRCPAVYTILLLRTSKKIITCFSISTVLKCATNRSNLITTELSSLENLLSNKNGFNNLIFRINLTKITRLLTLESQKMITTATKSLSFIKGKNTPSSSRNSRGMQIKTGLGNTISTYEAKQHQMYT